MGSEKSCGSLYQKYATNIQVSRKTSILKPDKYLVSMTIPAGNNQAVVSFSQYDGVNEIILTDGSAKVPSGKCADNQAGPYNGE